MYVLLDKTPMCFCDIYLYISTSTTNLDAVCCCLFVNDEVNNAYFNNIRFLKNSHQSKSWNSNICDECYQYKKFSIRAHVKKNLSSLILAKTRGKKSEKIEFQYFLALYKILKLQPNLWFFDDYPTVNVCNKVLFHAAIK